mmetsp:Transcript_37716/g.73078  ORF Transcript_37716/g.73078 Transcript_37716/m.73078 type:complete len:335 (+) Transcript_37716:144-1148(+)
MKEGRKKTPNTNPKKNPHVRGLGYINEFLQCRCAPELLGLGLYPNAKEITESFSMFNTVRRHLKNEFDTRDPDVVCVVVGDGNSPRTAAMLCYRTSWQVHSIDPIMKLDGKWARTRNLTTYRAKIEDVSILIPRGKKVLVVCMHTHVTLECCLYSLRIERQSDDESKEDRSKKVQVGIIACPCCQFTEIQTSVFGIAPDKTYKDISLLSDKNTIHLWKNIAPVMLKRFDDAAYVESMWERERVARYPKNWLRRHKEKLEKQLSGNVDWRECMRKRLAGYDPRAEATMKEKPSVPYSPDDVKWLASTFSAFVSHGAFGLACFAAGFLVSRRLQTR